MSMSLPSKFFLEGCPLEIILSKAYLLNLRQTLFTFIDSCSIISTLHLSSDALLLVIGE